jgi:hypothetical protein
MAGYIFIDRDDEMEGLRSQMRRNYRRGNYRNYGGSSANMREHYYKKGYEDARDDMEDEEMEMRRRRNSRGEFI